MEPEKKEEPKQQTQSQTWKYCKIIAIAALICAIALLGYVLFAPSSPKNMIGGKKGWKSRGGCGCVATPQA